MERFATFRLTAFGTFPEGKAREKHFANFLGSPLGELSPQATKGGAGAIKIA